ncbi:DUF7500 family protein [Natrialba asiatica]|nr:hypothetical protein [Natrialba asiatica]
MTDSNEGGTPDPKENADVPPVLPGEQPSGTKGGGALSPEDLDFTDSPYVAEVSDSRYVVSADHSPPDVTEHSSPPASRQDSPQTQTQTHSQSHTQGQPQTQPSQPAREQEQQQNQTQDAGQHHPDTKPQPQRQQHPQSQSQPPSQPQQHHPQHPPSPEHARSILAAELERSDARLAVDIVAQFGTDTVRHRTASDDVVGTFDNLVLWYAQHVARKTPTMQTASLLLSKSEFSPAITPSQVRKAAVNNGLDESATIGEFIAELE